jgi:hypothetical protein
MIKKYLVLICILMGTQAFAAADLLDEKALTTMDISNLISAGKTIQELEPLIQTHKINVDPVPTGSDSGLSYVTPLLAAVLRGDPEIVKWLINKYSARVPMRIDYDGRRGDTCLHICLRKKTKNYVLIAPILIEAWGHIDGENRDGETIRSVAIAANIQDDSLKRILGLAKPQGSTSAAGARQGSSIKQHAKSKDSVEKSKESTFTWLLKRAAGAAAALIILNELSKAIADDEEPDDQKTKA